MIHLILALPDSKDTMKWSFSVMKIIKTRLRNKIKNEFLINSIIIYIEKKIPEGFNFDLIIDDFKSLKE